MAPFKSTQSFSVGTFLRTFRNRDAVGPAALNSPVRSDRTPFEATGGNISAAIPGDGYAYHLFSSSGSFVIPGSKPAGTRFEVLLIAGGASGGSNDTSNGAGGGGAGGVVHHSQLDTSGTLTITIGAGGVHPNDQNTAGVAGSDSTIVSPDGPWTLTAKGGGGGGRFGIAGSPGGSGGGGGGYGGSYSNVHASSTQATQNPSFVPQTGFNQYGNDGGAPSDSNPGNAGGGGGAGGVGGSSPLAEGAPGASAGGVGRAFPGFPGILSGFSPMPTDWKTVSGPTGIFAGGGGGENPYSSASTSAGGPGGGGGFPAPYGATAVANTGSGGAAAGSGPGTGDGASGICMIRYQL